jgi:AraC-like DNA-binding protein/quercetin dioxygenase-like cupin family protein
LQFIPEFSQSCFPVENAFLSANLLMNSAIGTWPIKLGRRIIYSPNHYLSKMQIPGAKEPAYQRIGIAVKERILPWPSFPILETHSIWTLGTSTVPVGAEFDFWRPEPDIQQVLVVTKGEGAGLVENRWHPLREGQAYLTSANAPHAYRATGEWEICWCILKKNAFPDFNGPIVIRQTNPILWKHLLSGILEESIGTPSPLQMERWVELIHHECARIIMEPGDQRLWRLWGEVLDHLDASWDLPRLVRASGLNRETLRQRCVEEVGMTPKAYVTHLRMRHATSLLESGHKVEIVARMVGYENAFAFSVAFQRLMGTPPSEFRRRTRGEGSRSPATLLQGTRKAAMKSPQWQTTGKS